jgi:hypothetical protein
MKMKSKNTIKTEIHGIIDALLLEVNTRECATVPELRFAIATHPKFLNYITNTPELEAKVERDGRGKIVEITTPDNLAKIIKNRILWNFRNLKDERGIHVFHCFQENRQTGNIRYIPPRENLPTLEQLKKHSSMGMPRTTTPPAEDNYFIAPRKAGITH